MALFSNKTKSKTDNDISAGESQELDIYGAIQAHLKWKLRLHDYIEGKSGEELKPDVVGSDCQCALGKWIYGYGGENYGQHPKFQPLKETHAQFHIYAADVVRAVQSGEKEQAMLLLRQGEYPKISNRVQSMLASLSQDADFS